MQNSQTFASSKMQEFFDYFYTHKLWEYKGTESHPNLGRIDVYQIQDNAGHHIRNEKQYQIDHAYDGNHHHASRQVLPNYRVEQANGLPKWLPFTVGVKTTQNVSSVTADKLKNQIEQNINRFWNYHPELNRVFGYQQSGSELKLYIELQGTLEQDIQQRSAENRPYQEELLWKMLYSLVRASHKLNQSGQSLNDVRPSRVYYNQYQLSVIPSGIAQDQDQLIHYKFHSGEPVFYHNDIINDFHNHQNLNNSQMTSLHYNNEAFQIGMTILCAGLLKTETELSVCRNKTFNQSNLDQLLQDFGTIYGNNSRLLQFTLEELFLRGTRQNPSQVWGIFEQETDHFIFLESELQHHLSHLYQDNGIFLGRRNQFLNSTQIYPSLEFKRQYPNHFYYELRKIDYDTRLASIQSNNARVQEELRISRTQTSQVRQSVSPVRQSSTEKVKHAAHHHYNNYTSNNGNVVTNSYVRQSNTYQTTGSQVMRTSYVTSSVQRPYQ